MRTIGVISDTHGLLREGAVDALKDSDLILHAGDVGGAGILEVMSGIAPVFVVKGNNDYDEGASNWPKREGVHLSEGTSPGLAYMLHDISESSFMVTRTAQLWSGVVESFISIPARLAIGVSIFRLP